MKKGRLNILMYHFFPSGLKRFVVSETFTKALKMYKHVNNSSTKIVRMIQHYPCEWPPGMSRSRVVHIDSLETGLQAGIGWRGEYSQPKLKTF